MDNAHALRWAGLYVLLATVAAVLGLVIAGIGLLVGPTPARLYQLAWYDPGGFVRAGGPTVVLLLLGFLTWRVGRMFALYKTLATAIEEETAASFDAEALKSDVLSVLDDRLSEMHEDLVQTRRLVERGRSDEAATDFDFGPE